MRIRLKISHVIDCEVEPDDLDLPSDCTDDQLKEAWKKHVEEDEDFNLYDHDPEGPEVEELPPLDSPT